MEINSPQLVRIVDEYDFVFESGQLLPIVVDDKYGDKISFSPETVVVELGEQPHPVNPVLKRPAENITIFVSKLISIAHRKRELTEATDEVKNEWQKVVKELTSKVH